MIHPGNYTPADRPHDHPVTTLVLHTTEETHADTVRIFADPARRVSAHYLVRSRDGHVTPLLAERHIAWHAGNWHTNQHSVGIEHEGFAADGARWYTPALYRATAALVRGLAERYGVPLDRQHLLGHDNVPAATAGALGTMHTDPGPLWDWAHLLELLGRPVRPTAGPESPLLTLRRSAVLREEPDRDAAPAGPVSAGQRFVRAARSGRWTAVWYEGRRAWLADPADAVPTSGTLARTTGPAALHGSPLLAEPLPYVLTPGEAYACGGVVPAPGPDRWLSIQYGHRIGYVRGSAVELLEAGQKNSARLCRQDP